MAKQHLTEVSDKAKANEAYRVSSPDSAQSFQRGVQPISQLQRTLGNRDVARLIQAKRLSPSGEIIGLQRKLTVGAADDQYEQEADQVAHQVMNIPDSAVANSMQRVTSPEDDQEKMLQTKPLAASITPFVQREIVSDEEDKETPVQAKLASVQREISPEEDKDKPVQARFATEISKKSLQRQPEAVEEEEEPIQAKSAGSMSGSFEAGGDVESQISQSKGLGSPLPDPVRSYMEPRFGVDFSGVRVHTGNDAVQMNRAVGAQAFTHGSDVYFGEGRSPNNLELTAHELTHVVQQTGGGIRPKPIESDHVDSLEAAQSQVGKNDVLLTKTSLTNAPVSQRVVQRKLILTGNAGFRTRALAILNTGLFRYTAVMDAKSGEITLKANNLVGAPSTSQLAMYSYLNKIITDKKTTSIGIVSGSKHVIGGSYGLAQIDVADLESFAGNKGLSARSSMLHEIVEQYFKQVHGLAYNVGSKEHSGAHGKGMDAEKEISGYARGANKVISHKRNPDGTIDAVFETTYTKPGSKAVITRAVIVGNNIISTSEREVK